MDSPLKVKPMKKKLLFVSILLFFMISVATAKILFNEGIINFSIPLLTNKKPIKDVESLPRITWDMLSRFDHKTGKGPEELMKLDGKTIRMPGYVVPLTDSYTKLKEFLLLPDGQACIHVPPPPPNLIVAVNMRRTLSLDEVYSPTWVIGVFKIETSSSKYGGAAYKLDGIQLEEFDLQSY